MTPNVQSHNNNNNVVGGAKPVSAAGQPGDRMALMTYSDQVSSSCTVMSCHVMSLQEHGVLLPSYEEALREGVSSANGSGRRSVEQPQAGPISSYRHQAHRQGRHHPVQAEVQAHVKLPGHYTRGQRRQRAEPDTVSDSHGQCHHRQQSGSNSGSLR